MRPELKQSKNSSHLKPPLNKSIKSLLTNSEKYYSKPNSSISLNADLINSP